MTLVRSVADEIRADDDFNTLHVGLTVEMIMTHRSALTTCRLDESRAEVMKRIKDCGPYDFLPVIDSNHDDQIVGLFHVAGHNVTDDNDSTLVQGDYRGLVDDQLIGADASILDYIRQGNERPFRLVVSGTGIAGVVTLSDLDKLPARAALFSMITGFESAMSQFIESIHPNNDWQNLLSTDRKDELKKRICESRKKDSFVSNIVLTQFCDKATVLKKGWDCHQISKKALKKQLKGIEDLRDNLAHANRYDWTSLHKVVSDLLNLRCHLVRAIRNG